MKQLQITILMVLALVVASVAHAGDTVCVGALSGAHDNVTVPAGETCIISDAQIEGSVKVYGGVDIYSPTTIKGSIDGESGNTGVRLWGGANLVVEGNVQINKSPGSPAGSGYWAGTQIHGNFQYEENVGFLTAAGGLIGGNFKAEKNTGGGDIVGNTISQNLECKENTPALFQAGNVVGGALKCHGDHDLGQLEKRRR